MRTAAASLVATASALACVLWGAAGGSPEPDGLELIGLQVGKRVDDAKFTRLRVQRREGTCLTLRITRKDKALLGVDAEASRIIRFRDDRGTDLTRCPRGQVWENWIGFPVQVSDDGHEVILDVCAPGVPAADAAKVALQANIVLQCGSGLRTVQQADVPLKNGSRITVGPAPTEVRGLAAGGAGEGVVFTLAGTAGDERIRTIAFLAPDGKELPCTILGKNQFGFAGTMTYETTYRLQPGKADAVAVRVAYYERIEKLTVPVELSAGVGL